MACVQAALCSATVAVAQLGCLCGHMYLVLVIDGGGIVRFLLRGILQSASHLGQSWAGAA